MCLLLYAAAVCVLAPRLLTRLTGSGASPRFGVATWLIVLASVLVAWIGAAGLLAGWMVSSWNRPGHVWGACFTALRSAAVGHDGALSQLVLVLVAATLAVFVTALAARVCRHLVRARARTDRHAESARIIGRRVVDIGALVIDAPEKIVYCLGGRPGTIVITSAAVASLHDRRHLDAALSHERAHLAGRHHLLLASTRALATSLPRIRVFTAAEEQVSRLLEMCADDTAARTHGATTVLAAILALTGAGPIPFGALGASTVGVCARITRLAAPMPPRRQTWVRVALSAFIAVLLAAPFLAAWASAHGLTACGPFAA